MEVKFSFSKEDYAAIAKELYALMVAQAVPAAYQPAPAPAPAPVVSLPPVPAAPFVVPAPVQTLDAVTYQRQGGVEDGRQDTRLDDIVPAGTPGTVTLTKTGHVLSVPQPGSESWGGYLVRVYKQAGASSPRSAMEFGDAAFARFGGFRADGSNWPITADACYNPGAYVDPAVKAASDAYNASIGWDGIPGHANDPFISNQTPVVSPPKALSGRVLDALAVRAAKQKSQVPPAVVYDTGATPVKIEQ